MISPAPSQEGLTVKREKVIRLFCRHALRGYTGPPLRPQGNSWPNNLHCARWSTSYWIKGRYSRRCPVTTICLHKIAVGTTDTIQAQRSTLPHRDSTTPTKQPSTKPTWSKIGVPDVSGTPHSTCYVQRCSADTLPLLALRTHLTQTETSGHLEAPPTRANTFETNASTKNIPGGDKGAVLARGGQPPVSIQ